MSLVEKYLNIGNYNFVDLLGQELSEHIINYQKNFILYQNNPNKLKLELEDKLVKNIDSIYSLINIEDADINYYLEHIIFNAKTKFGTIIRKIGIENIIGMMDYGQKDKNNYMYFRNEYFKYFNSKIINGKYKILKQSEPKTLFELINDNWVNISFENLLNFTFVINQMKYYQQDIKILTQIYQDKFSSKDNITKLVSYISTNFVEEIEKDFGTEEHDNFNTEKKFNFRFIIDNLKSNGFELFEEYYAQIISRYKNSINIEEVKKDKKIIHYFMKIISEKDSTAVNRVVNELLIKIRNYLYDIEDSYNANQDYQKIKVNTKSDKYRNFDLESLKREKHNFTILKYLFGDETIPNYKLNRNIEPYFDIYRAYYSSRYPDREISFDIIKSSITVEMTFDKTYFFHMGLIQYIVLDKIIESKGGLTITEISANTGIPIGNLKETINSLLKIKLIGKTSGNTIETIKIIQNTNFTYEKTKISIYSMIQKEKPTDKFDSKPKDFLHDRNTIVYANLIDWVKKSKYFYRDTLIESIKYKIPFTVTDEQLDYAINQGLKDDIIKKIPVSKTSHSEFMFQYVE